jgi:hypothetical protein
LEITLTREFDSEIVWHKGLITITQKCVYSGGERFSKPLSDVKVTMTPRLRHVVAAFTDGPRLRFYDLTGARELKPGFEGEEVMESEGQLYVRQHGSIFAVNFMELRSGILPVGKLVANVMMKSTRLFEGVALQNILGAHYGSLLSSSGGCHSVRLSELDGYQLVDSRLYRNVLMVVGAKGGRYDKFIFRFKHNFSSFDSRLMPNISPTTINFTVLDGGVVLHMTDEGTLELFSELTDASGIRVIQDLSIQGDVSLFHSGAQAMLARGNKLYKIRMRK